MGTLTGELKEKLEPKLSEGTVEEFVEAVALLVDVVVLVVLV